MAKIKHPRTGEEVTVHEPAASAENEVNETVTDAGESTAEAPVASEPGKPAAPVGQKAVEKKNQKVQVLYLGDEDAEGKRKEFSGPNPQVRAMKVITKNGEQLIKLSDLSPDVMLSAAIFGLNTAWRNTHNSNENAGKDGIAAMQARLNANLNGQWSAEGEATEQGVPLIIEAMIAVKKKANAYTEGMEKVWLDHYFALDAKNRAAQTKLWLDKPSINAAFMVIKAQRAAEKAQAALAKAGEVADIGADF